MDKNYPEQLLYTKDHEWCRIEGNIATIGITWHAQDALGDIVFCELPEVGSHIEAGSEFGTVESVKAVSELYAPITGKVVESNGAVVDTPADLNEDMYEKAWMIKVEMTKPEEREGLLSRDAYVALLEKEAD